MMNGVISGVGLSDLSVACETVLDEAVEVAGVFDAFDEAFLHEGFQVP
jgi:hypothetical protein